MLVLANTEEAVRTLLREKVAAGQIPMNEASRLLTTGFRTITATIANWRKREATPEQITAAITRRMDAARLHKTQAARLAQTHGTRDERIKKLVAKANHELIIAELYQTVWQGMQRDVAAYQS